MENMVLVAPVWSKPLTTEVGALDAWITGKDFKILSNGKYCSIRDLPMLKYLNDHVFIRYNNDSLVQVF